MFGRLFKKKTKKQKCDLCGIIVPTLDRNGNPNTIVLNGVRVCSKCHEYEVWYSSYTLLWKLKVWGHISHELFAKKRDSGIETAVSYAKSTLSKKVKLKRKKNKK